VPHEPQAQVQQQLEEGKGPRPAGSHQHRQRLQRLLHKTTTTISENHALVCIEDLQVRNMSRSAKGTVEQTGKQVAQKARLNRAILDQGWGEFKRQLGYKMSWNGGMLLAVPAHHTSQTCPCCGHVSKDNRQTQAKFLCVGCGYVNHADVVGAINVLERGHRLLACRELAQSAPLNEA
jgi:putative transposase